MKFKFFTTILFIFIFCFSLFSQKQPDAGMWNTFSLEKEITNDLSICFDQELRFKENYSRLNLLYTNISADYNVFKGFNVSIGYRFIDKYRIENRFSFRNRLMGDISYKYKFNKVTISYRSRLQAEVRDYYSSEVGKIPEWYWRNKFELKYKISKFTPYAGTEFRYQILDPRNPNSNHGLHRARMYAGVDYDINKRNTIGAYYLVQQEYDIDDPADVYIFGLQYTIVLKKE